VGREAKEKDDHPSRVIKMDGNINSNKWREWKHDHGVSSTTYNILLNQPPKGFWLVRLTNKGKLKLANNMIKKFPTVLPFFWKFLALKAAFRKWEGRICLRSYVIVVNEFEKN
jgi:hypothetical protein